MRRWKQIGSIADSDIQSKYSQHNSSRQMRSRMDSPFKSFHQNLHNKSQPSIMEQQKTFCQEYVQRMKENARNISYDDGKKRYKDRKMSLESKDDDMFTNMKKILREESLPESKIQSQSLSHSEENKVSTKEKLRKTDLKLRKLKKEQQKLKKLAQNDMTSIKNIFHQISQMYHIHHHQTPASSSQPSHPIDTNLLRQIITDAMQVDQYFAQMDKKKHEIMIRLNQL